ncbi:uncharacterized protein K489DRAFT_308314, partial [Dissoconium aciculare CBS 342.82]|uniref:Transcriptional co-activator n=1 Tax=Dissoconium aciculare CBS 342.82 TaxID=1314786 RepID=A0A6J3LP65_9PEZI
RVELEGLYGQLKAALGEAWGDYKIALGQFALGSLSQAELSWVLQPLLCPPAAAGAPAAETAKTTTSPLHLHNAFLIALYANSMRDPPPNEVAPWVVATDKPSNAAKNAGAVSGINDQVEERLKREVMALHKRDRKRIKGLSKNAKTEDTGLQEILDYMQELAVKPPSQSQANNEGAGLGKTNWDIEIRRRYAQPLASETLEFPTLNEMQNRIEPICFEEGLTGGVQQGSLQGVAELVERSAEVFIKETLSRLLSHARSNAADGMGVQTNMFKRQLRKEELALENGTLQRNAAGLLPVQMDAQVRKDPLTAYDLRLSMGLCD